MLDYLVLDCETLPCENEAIADLMREEVRAKEPPENYKKPEAIRKWREEQMADLPGKINKTAVDPMLARVFVIGMKRRGKDAVVLDSMDGSSEVRLLEVFFDNTIQVSEETIIIGHNVAAFDLPLLFNAFIRNGMTPPAWFPKWTGRYWKGRVFDTMRKIPSQNGYISQTKACLAYGICTHRDVMWKGSPMDGSRILEAYQTREFEVIREYSRQDLSDAEALFLRLTQGGQDTGFEDAGWKVEIQEEIAKIRESSLSPQQKYEEYNRIFERRGVLLPSSIAA